MLARQRLLERADAPLARALEAVAGIQAQYAPSMYVGLWSRLDGFERRTLTQALEQRTVVQGTLMRGTIHLVSREDYWPFALATREARRRWWLRARPDTPSPRAMAAAARRLARELDGGTLTAREVAALLGPDRAAGVGLWLDLVRVPPSGTWERRRADRYAAAHDWVGPAPQIGERAARAHVVRRYLRGFGPASAGDVASFTGLPPATVRTTLHDVELRRFASEQGEELLDLPDAPLPSADTPAPPRLLPTWDATLLAHARRSGVLREEDRPRIFSSRNPHSFPTFTVDGVVAGSWRHEGGPIRLEPFGALDPAARAELDEEAERLAAFHA